MTEPGKDRSGHVDSWNNAWRKAPRCPRRFMVFNWLIYYWIRDLIPDFRDLSFVELGGAGELLAILADRARAVTALDISETALDRCRALLAAKPNASCIQADLLTFTPEKELFDVAMSFGVIEHFDPDTMLESVKAHARCAEKYVLIGVPSDVPRNWWRAVDNLRTAQMPPWKPMDVRDLWDLFERAEIEPIAATRLDPTYGHRGAYWRFYRLAIKLGLLRSRALAHHAGGLAIMLGRVASRSAHDGG